MKNKWTNYLYVATLLFFTLGFVNIIFGWLGFICMITPFVLLIKNKKKTWCHKYCPRSNLFSVLFKNRSLTGKNAPKWFTNGKIKWFILVYFVINLFILCMSTYAVFIGKVEPMENVRLMIAFKIPYEMPQLLNLNIFPNWAVHLSFRMYSMMLTTTILGLILGYIFKPRTWCTVCPINTISTAVIKK